VARLGDARAPTTTTRAYPRLAADRCPTHPHPSDVAASANADQPAHLPSLASALYPMMRNRTHLPACLQALAASWRVSAAELRRYGAEAQALTLESAADDVLVALARADDAVLTLGEAARESGYSAEHLGRLLREGRLPNAGRRGRPRIRAADLPRRARGPIAEGPSASYDPVADARSLASRR
jgi:hypothetical protein